MSLPELEGDTAQIVHTGIERLYHLWQGSISQGFHIAVATVGQHTDQHRAANELPAFPFHIADMVAGKVYHEHLAGLVLKVHGGTIYLPVSGQQLAELGVLVALWVSLPEQLAGDAGALEFGEKMGYPGSKVGLTGVFGNRFVSRIDKG